MNVEVEAGAGSPCNQGGAPWLSILVPVYNVQPYVEECLRSILGQLDADSGVELILLDDRSTDESAALCSRIIAESASSVRLMHHDENRGISAARNSLLEAAAGEYIWFIDADDMILPGAIDELGHIVGTLRPDMVLCDYVRGDNERFRAFRGSAGQLTRCKETLIAGVFANRRLHLWTKIFKRELCGAIRFPEGAWFEDIATVPWLMLTAETFYYAAEPWIFYRSRPGSIIAQVARARGHFNTRRYNDMAGALTGFRHDLQNALPPVAPETEFFVGRFLAREYFKLFKRLIRARGQWANWSEARAELRRYRQTMEENSPLPFPTVARHYVRRGQIGLALGLYAAMAFSGRSAKNSGQIARPAAQPLAQAHWKL